MTFNELQKVNDSLKKMDIKGKEYVTVNERIKAFRIIYPTGYITTEMIFNENGVCAFKATVGFHEELSSIGEPVVINKILATGHAYEKESSSYINKTSYIENCETSAVGRALGMAGFGIDTSIASYEEVSNAQLQQEGLRLASDDLKRGMMAEIEKKAEASGIEAEEMLKIVLEHVGFDRNKQPEGITVEQYGKAMNFLIGGKK